VTDCDDEGDRLAENEADLVGEAVGLGEIDTDIEADLDGDESTSSVVRASFGEPAVNPSTPNAFQPQQR
jgi:hypothetical protein